MNSNPEAENGTVNGTQTVLARTRLEQAEMRAENAEARTEQAKTRIEQAETRIEAAETRTEQAEARTEHAKARTERAEMRTEQAETRSEQAIRASELSYRRLFEAAKDGIMILEAGTGQISDVNPYLIQMLGFAHDELVGTPIWELGPFKDIVSNRTRFEEIRQQGYVLDENLSLETKDGRKIAVEFVSNVYEAGDKKVIQCDIRDITERKQAERKIQSLNAELERRVAERTAELEAANQELEAFSYSVSHDLRAPLRAINGFAGMVMQQFAPQLPADAQKYLERIRSGGQQMGELIDDLLAFSCLSRQPLKCQTVATTELVKNLLADFMAQNEGRPIEFQTGTLPDCWGDPALLKQVWVNLLSNAIKYSRGREPAVIEIGRVEEDGENAFFVRDNGTGFDMKYAHKLFMVFQRLHRAEDFEGTGVGLAIVQRIIHRHGGRVWVAAEEGRGAIFRFTLAHQNPS